MKTILKLFSLFLLAVLVFLPARTASASAGVFEGQVIFGQSYTLQSGQTLSGDLLVFGGTAEIQVDAKVEGNIVLFGGELTVDGEATGDVAAIGATVTLGPDAHIGGDMVTVGATLEQAETAQVDGQIYNTATSWSEASNGEYPIEPVIPEPEITTPEFNFDFHPFRYFWNVVGNAIFLGLLAMLLMLFLARQAETVAQAAVKQTLTAGGLALLTVIVAPFALLLLTITIVLIPVAVLVALALGVAVLFGWIALGYEVGRRLTTALHWQWHPALSAGLGTFLLSLVVNAARILNFIPGMQCFSWVLPALVGLFALGAVIMTRFGTQPVQATTPTAVPPVPTAAPIEVSPTTVEVLPPVPPAEPRRTKKSQ